MSKFNELIKGDIPVLVDFYADWCGPCKMMAPILKEVKNSLGHSLKVIKVDVDKNQQAASHFAVQGVPTLILFQRGKQVWRQSGVVPKEQLIAVIRRQTGI